MGNLNARSTTLYVDETNACLVATTPEFLHGEELDCKR